MFNNSHSTLFYKLKVPIFNSLNLKHWYSSFLKKTTNNIMWICKKKFNLIFPETSKNQCCTYMLHKKNFTYSLPCINKIIRCLIKVHFVLQDPGYLGPEYHSNISCHNWSIVDSHLPQKIYMGCLEYFLRFIDDFFFNIHTR